MGYPNLVFLIQTKNHWGILVRHAGSGKLCFPELSGIRPISLKPKEELCASTVLPQASDWHGSLLTHIIAENAQTFH
ncbi:MAG: hypothetical protein ACLUVX_05155 [Lachnospira pectinoschiza]